MLERAPMKQNWSALDYLKLSIFWFALSVHWGALLSIVIPEMAKMLAGPYGKGTVLGVVSTAGACVSALVQITVGYLSDRHRGPWGRRRPFVFWGTLGAPLGLYFLGNSHSLVSFLFSVVLIQLTLNVANGPYQALLPDLVPRRNHGRASMWMGLFQHGGQVFGPLAAGYYLSRSGAALSELTAILAVLLLVGMLITVLGVHEEPLTEPEPERAPLWDIFRIPLRPYPAFVQLLYSRFVINLGYYAVVNFLLFYVQDSLGVQDYKKAAGELMAFMVVGGLIGGIPVGPLADKVNKVKLIYGLNSITALAAVGFALAPNLWWAYLCGILLGTGFGAFQVVDWAVACSRMPESGKGRYMGVWNLTSVLAQMIPLVLGPATDFMTELWGAGISYRCVMVVVVIFLVSGTALLRPLPEDEPVGTS